MSGDINIERAEKPARNSAIELLRIFCMVGVFVLHYNNPNIGGGDFICGKIFGELFSALFF